MRTPALLRAERSTGPLRPTKRLFHGLDATFRATAAAAEKFSPSTAIGGNCDPVTWTPPFTQCVSVRQLPVRPTFRPHPAPLPASPCGAPADHGMSSELQPQRHNTPIKSRAARETFWQRNISNDTDAVSRLSRIVTRHATFGATSGDAHHRWQRSRSSPFRICRFRGRPRSQCGTPPHRQRGWSVRLASSRKRPRISSRTLR